MMNLTPHSASPSLFSSKGSFYFAALFFAVMMVAIPLPRTQALLPCLLGGIAFIAFSIRHGAFPPMDKAMLCIMLAFIALGAASSLWAMHGDYVLVRAGKTAAVLLSSFALTTMARMVSPDVKYKDCMVRIAVIGCAISLLVFFFEYHGGFALCRWFKNVAAGDVLPAEIAGGFILNRGTVFLTLLCLPVFLAVYASALPRTQKIVYAGLAFSGLGAALYATQSQTAQIAVVLAFLMMLYPSHNKIARRLLLGCVLVTMFCAPLIPGPAHEALSEAQTEFAADSYMTAASIPHRLEVWDFVAQKISEKPLLGHGMDSTRFLHSDQIMPNMRTHNVLHPHNAVLQIWIEFGLVGALLAAAFVAYLFYKMESLCPLLQRYYAALFVVLMGVLSTGYGLWQAWQLGFLFSIPAFSMMVTKLYPERFKKAPSA